MNKQPIPNADELKYWLALTSIKEVGPITVKKLLAAFRTPKNILAASLKELKQVEDIKASRARAIHEFDSWELVDQEIGKIDELGVRAVTFDDRNYPESLRQIDDAPILLYMKGEIRDEDRY